MTISMDKTYRTERHGKIRILCVDAPGDYPVIGYCIKGCGTPKLMSWTFAGLRHRDGKTPGFDLIEVTPEREAWVNEYENIFSCWKSRESADLEARVVSKRIRLHRIVLSDDTVYREGE